MLNIELPHDPHNLLGLDPTEIKTDVCTRTCTQTFIAALFLMAKDENPNAHQLKNETRNII